MTIKQKMQTAIAAVRQQQFQNAISILNDVLAKEPGQLQARWLLLQAYENMGEKDAAFRQLEKMLLQVTDNLMAIDQLAAHAVQRAYPLKSILQAFSVFLARQPHSANGHFNYAWHLAKDGQFEAAINRYQQALNLGIGTPEEVHLNIANIYSDHLNNHGKAKAGLRQALALNPGYSNAYFNLGNLAEQDGNRNKAKQQFKKCLEIDPGNQLALARLADAHQFKNSTDPLFAQLKSLSQTSKKSDLHFAMAKAYEQLNEFELAWRHFEIANEIDAQAFPVYDRKSTETFFHHIKNQSSEHWLARHSGKSHETVFICGMFRTGSTLLEQILAAHPNFYPGGESKFFPRLIARHFPQYPAGLDAVKKPQLLTWKKQQRQQSSQLAAGNKRLTDKRPDNFLYLGLIKAIMPSAQFVVTERDWRDVATSVFCTRLGPQQNYATNLSNTRHYLGLQQELVGHWAHLLGGDLLRLRYEDLIAEPQSTITKLLEGLGEKWDERCLTFDQLTNSVKTASVWQVREPLHSKSIGRWKNYASHFENTFGEQVYHELQA